MYRSFYEASGHQNKLIERCQSFYRTDEKTCARNIGERALIPQDSQTRIYNIARQIIERIKDNKLPNFIESFMQEYKLSDDEGVALMCLAESLLRIPDNYTIDELIRDRLAEGQWGKHSGNSKSFFVNASTWGLIISGNILKTANDSNRQWYNAFGNLLKKCGEPIIRKVAKQMMQVMGDYFVMNEEIGVALEKSRSNPMFALCSFDMLGEAARTSEDAERYFRLYMYAIESVGNASEGVDLHDAHSVSIKLSALHPRYEIHNLERLLAELLPKIVALCQKAKEFNIGVCIDAEEARRLEVSLVLFERLRFDESLNGWEGLGIAVQAYQKRAPAELDFLEDLAIRSHHKIVVRLVKGAYWDAEIKESQEMGLEGYPVFTRRTYTDVSYLVCAQKLLSKPNNFYPCFATHNAYTLATIIEIADKNHPGFELQRLYGMGESLYNYVTREIAPSIRCRIYAPIGNHKDLLPYLIRRLLENGANSSFINKLHDPNVKIEELVHDPVERAKSLEYEPNLYIALPKDIFGAERENSMGVDFTDSIVIDKIYQEINNHHSHNWQAASILNGQPVFGDFENIINPAYSEHIVGRVSHATPEIALEALSSAHTACTDWGARQMDDRAVCLKRAADSMETDILRLISILVSEAGKTIPDAIAEIREAVDFLRYYAGLAQNEFSVPKKLPGPVGEDNFIYFDKRGVFLCISPWNFPLAIFIGQIAAALVMGNAVLAKPAEQTPIIAFEAVKMLHEAGVPSEALQLLLGSGELLGKALIPDNRIAGIAFTGSTQTALLINRMLAHRDGPIVPFIAETGGLNAMIVDSSALTEQVTVDVVSSAFRSSGQRCSSLRVLFVQEEVADKQIKMICGAMQELKVGDPALVDTDVGPIIDQHALELLVKHTKKMSKDAELLFKTPMAELKNGYFFPPHIYEIQNISQLKQEVFGPILHVIRYKSDQLDQIIDEINNTGYGLTFSVQSRIQNSIDRITQKVLVGNVYVNRNQIGAVVGVQPFGGRGLSGTGPKAGGPSYLHRFATEKVVSVNTTALGGNTTLMCLSDN